MPSRAPAFPKELRAPVVVDAVRAGARTLILLSVFTAVAVFAALSTMAPRQLALASLEMSVIAGIAALLFGLAWIMVATALGSMPNRKAAGSQSQANERVAPPPKLICDEPLVREMTNAEIAGETNAAEPVALKSEPFADSVPLGPSPAATTVTKIDSLSARLKEHGPSGGGHRALITSASEAAIPFSEARALAAALTESGAQTILIDWSPSGEGFAAAIGITAKAGWNDLMKGAARFDEIIQRLPGTRAHVIASGRALGNASAKFDADFLNLALDALDEVYDHIVVTARHDEARALFECIEGRFDAGITVVPSDEVPSRDERNAFIGFEVVDIDLIRFERPESLSSPIAQRIARATRPRESVVQPA